MNRQERYYQEEYRREGLSFKSWVQIIAAIIILGIVGTVVFLALPTIQALSGILGIVIVGTIILAIPLSLAGGAFYFYTLAENKKIAARRFAANANNVYTAYLDEKNGRFIQAINGPQPEQVPAHYSPTIHNQNDVAQLTKLLEYAQSTKVQEIDAPGTKKPIPTARQLLQDGTVKKTIEGGEIILGFLEDGSMKTLAYDLLYSTDLGGVGGSGKTTTAYWLCVQEIIAGTRLIVVDPHLHVKRRGLAQGLGQMLAPYHHSYQFAPCDDAPDKILMRARWMRDENKRRQGEGVDLDAEQQIMMVIDEFNSIIEISEIREELGDIIATVQREGRKLGLFFLLVGHRWSQQDIGNIKIRTNAATVMAHYYNDADQAGKLLGGQGKLCQDLKSGSYWLRGLMTGDLIKVSTPMIDERDTALILDVMGKPTDYPTGRTVEAIGGATITDVTTGSSSRTPSTNQAVTTLEDATEGAQEGTGRTDDRDYTFELKKMLREAGKMKKQGVATDTILKQLGLKPGGRNNQDLQIVLEMIDNVEEG